MRHLDLVRRVPRGVAADPKVAAAVDREALARTQPVGHGVGGQALAAPAAVELEAGRAADRAARVVDVHAPPARSRVRAGGPARRCRGEGLGEAGRRHPGQRGPVAGAAQRRQHGRVDEAVRSTRRPQAGGDRGPQQRRGGHGGAPIAVERAQLAVLAEARQARVEGGKPPARVVEAGAVGPQEPDVGAHAAEGQLVLGHDVLVTSGAGAGREPGKEREQGPRREREPERAPPVRN